MTMDKELNFALAYSALGKRKQTILLYLLRQKDYSFRGNYTMFAIHVYNKESENRNIRNEIKLLEGMDLLTVYYTPKNGCLGMKLKDNWRDLLIKWYNTENPKDWFLTQQTARDFIRGC